jgi:hypothetical protein
MKSGRIEYNSGVKAAAGTDTKLADLAAAQKTLAARFPFLNLAGLAALGQLAIRITAKDCSPTIFYKIDLSFQANGDVRTGYIEFRKNTQEKRLIVNWFYPGLPERQNLGATLFTLILLKGNACADWEIIVDIPSTTVFHQIQKMRGFSVRCDLYTRGDVHMKAPRLTAEETEAVEFYWASILKCPDF